MNIDLTNPIIQDNICDWYYTKNIPLEEICRVLEAPEDAITPILEHDPRHNPYHTWGPVFIQPPTTN